MMKRRQFSAEFKAHVAREALLVLRSVALLRRVVKGGEDNSGVICSV